VDGAVIINKPSGFTSHDVVARLRRIANERSIGHLGTLDPAATGVLPLLLGRLTRLAQFFQGREKEYRGEIRLGFATDTYDATGTPVGDSSSGPWPAAERVAAALEAFRGSIQQVPPPYSAKKVEGVRAYRLARQQRPVGLAPVAVEIRELELEAVEGDLIRVRVVCSSGTYIRSLAHDLGQTLGTGAHLHTLERTRVGEFKLEHSHTLEDLSGLAEQGRLAEALLPALELLPEYPAVTAPAEAAARLLQGRAANLPEFSHAPRVRVFRLGVEGDVQLLAIGRRVAGSLFHPQMVLAGQSN
jgi:tRNA pseudouridine55 synthase